MMAKQKNGSTGKVPCPRCRKMSPWEDNPWRPFCSQRCQQIDLAAWADGDYRFPSEDAPATDEGEEGG